MPELSSSFSVATTIFVSLAICAIVSYGIFYYFKQRMSVIEQSQMEQARIMQAIISHGLNHQSQQQQQQQQQQQLQEHVPGQPWHKEITITQNGLIEVSSDSESESDSESDSESCASDSDESSASSHSDLGSMTDPVHAQDIKCIHIDSIDDIDIDIEHVDETHANQTKKIISLKANAVALDNDSAEDDDESSSSDDEDEDQDPDKVQDKEQGQSKAAFELKIGYKHKKEPLHLNYGNMSVPALRQLAKERGLGGEDADLQKLKKKDLVQLLQ
jgi:hypothetical protein